MPASEVRCDWVDLTKQDYVSYHDEEWGVPILDENQLFEALCLEGAQAGLSWYTILKKRNHYRKVFSSFDASKIVTYSEAYIKALVSDAGIVRHEGKIRSVVNNARVCVGCADQFGSFKEFISITWRKSQGEDRYSQFSKELKLVGFTFVGPTIMESFAQAIGLVNAHSLTCFRHSVIAQLKSGTKKPT